MNKYYLLALLFILGLILSALRPHDYFTWLMEVLPAILGFLVLIATFGRFRFSYLTCVMILLHSYILFVGGHYTYAEVPAFNWIREAFHQSRNNYDKLDHFAQGFVPAMIVRELFIRLEVFKKESWIPFLTVSLCLSISALYEFLEWLVAILSGQAAEAFLGTQGYAWDTQSDMLFATIGAICMIVFFSGLQNRQIAKMRGGPHERG